jgi:broad specificity phosphatase PhoE
MPQALPAVVLIRHADVASGGGSDPPLSAAGSARARELAHVLGDAGVAAILVTSLQRSRQTAAPLAAALALTPAVVVDPVPDAVAAIRAQPAGAAVLVVGHTNTVPETIAALGGPADVTIGDDEFDRLFVLANGRLVALRYGV